MRLLSLCGLVFPLSGRLQGSERLHPNIVQSIGFFHQAILHPIEQTMAHATVMNILHFCHPEQCCSRDDKYGGHIEF